MGHVRPLARIKGMMRLFVTLSALAILHSAMAAEPRLVAFERAGEIWVANLDGTGAKKIARGVQPNISPDGKSVAFNTESEKSLDRRIAFADIATKKITVFQKEIPSQNCQHAVWSPDSSQILFNLFTEDEWHLGLINADGSGFRYAKKAPPGKSISFWSAAWAPDGKSIYVQDLDKISQLSLDGAVLKTWDLHTLFPDGGLSSASHLSVSPDGNSLVVDVEVDEEVNRKGLGWTAARNLDFGFGQSESDATDTERILRLERCVAEQRRDSLRFSGPERETAVALSNVAWGRESETGFEERRLANRFAVAAFGLRWQASATPLWRSRGAYGGGSESGRFVFIRKQRVLAKAPCRLRSGGAVHRACLANANWEECDEQSGAIKERKNLWLTKKQARSRTKKVESAPKKRVMKKPVVVTGVCFTRAGVTAQQTMSTPTGRGSPAGAAAGSITCERPDAGFDGTRRLYVTYVSHKFLGEIGNLR